MVISVLTKLCKVIPTWRIIPTQDIIDRAIKNPEWRKEVIKMKILKKKIIFFYNLFQLPYKNFQVRNNSYCYKGKPRLKTGYELLMASLDIEKNLSQVKIPTLFWIKKNQD